MSLFFIVDLRWYRILHV